MYKETELEIATKKWNKEVDAEVVALLEEGYPPRDAVDRAILIVSERRKKRDADF